MRHTVIRGVSVLAIITIGAFSLAACGRAGARGSEPVGGRLADSGMISPSVDDPSATAFWADLAPVLGDVELGVTPEVQGEPSDYASIVFRPGQPAADLYWKGAVPGAVLDVIAAHPDVTVATHDVPWSLADLIEARDVATEVVRARGYDNFLVGPMPDASGILLTLSVVPAAEAEQLRRLVEQSTDVLTFVEGDRELVGAARPSDP